MKLINYGRKIMFNRKIYRKPKVITEYKWLFCYYIWRIEWTNRIVCYEWEILEDLWDYVKCSMVDRYIHTPNDKIEITLPKKKIKIIK